MILAAPQVRAWAAHSLDPLAQRSHAPLERPEERDLFPTYEREMPQQIADVMMKSLRQKGNEST